MKNFQNRTDAGKQLAEKIGSRDDIANPVILALPRGGIPIGLEIAHQLNVPFDVFLVRKLGVPGQEELAMGAVAYDDGVVLNEDIIFSLGISKDVIDTAVKRQQRELERRNKQYRQGKPAPRVKDKTVILADDGLATGATMRAAVQALREQFPARIIVAVPVAPTSVYETLAEADEVICLWTPEPFFSVGSYYSDFHQLTDDDVRLMLTPPQAA